MRLIGVANKNAAFATFVGLTNQFKASVMKQVFLKICYVDELLRCLDLEIKQFLC